MAKDRVLWERIRGRDAGAFETLYRDKARRLCVFGKEYFLFRSDPIPFGNMKIWVKHDGSIREPIRLRRATAGSKTGRSSRSAS